MRHLLVLLIPVALLACDGGMTTCTTEIRYSVTVTVEDDAGDPVDDATVQYSVDGGAPVACEDAGAGIYSCGEEVEGDITVTATADGLGTDEASVMVEADECHVITESVTLTLPIED